MFEESDYQPYMVNGIRKRVRYVKYSVARNWIKMYAPYIHDKKDYHEAYSENLIPTAFPINPKYAYKNDGWVSWSDYLGKPSDQRLLRGKTKDINIYIRKMYVATVIEEKNLTWLFPIRKYIIDNNNDELRYQWLSHHAYIRDYCIKELKKKKFTVKEYNFNSISYMIFNEIVRNINRGYFLPKEILELSRYTFRTYLAKQAYAVALLNIGELYAAIRNKSKYKKRKKAI